MAPLRSFSVSGSIAVAALLAGLAGQAYALIPPCATLSIVLAADARPDSQAASLRRIEDEGLLVQDEVYFGPILGELKAALAGVADVEGMTHRVLEGGTPHLLVFAEGAGDSSVHGHPVLQTVRALAGNHGLGLEFQATPLSDGAVLFGFILFKPFPTLELCWERHPEEMVAGVDDGWALPFADLSDVERIDIVNERATLVLSEAAAVRIGRLSSLHRHRRYFVRGADIAEAGHLGTYTWLTGVRTVPGVPREFTCRQPRRDGQWKEGVQLTFLHQRYAVHAEARAAVCTELGLPEEVSWTVAEATPNFAASIYLWPVHRPVDGGSAFHAPWMAKDDGATRPWQELRKAPFGEPVTAAIPRRWRFETATSSVLAPDPAAGAFNPSEDEALRELLHAYPGRELAVLSRGEVIALAEPAASGTARLSLTQMVPGAQVLLAGALVQMPDGEAATAYDTDAGAASPVEPDRFQVRLMAEPQDRKLIPVTHFAAPGKPPGVVVAVQNDVILDGRSVVAAALESKNDALLLRLSLTEEAQDVLDGVCFSNMGKQLAIVYDGRLLSAPTIMEWDQVELAFKGMDDDWPEVAQGLADYLSE